MKKLPIILLAMLPAPLQAFELHEWGTFTTVSGSDGSFLTGLHVEEEELPSFVYSHVGMNHSVRNQYGFYRISGNRSREEQSDSKQMEVSFNQSDKKYYYSNISGGLPQGSKGFPLGAKIVNTNVKMETPVIYFYGGAGESVNVKVGFNGGTISQWYPHRVSGDTPNKIELATEQMSESLQSILKKNEGYTFVENKPRDFSNNYQGSIEWDVELLEADDAFTFKHTQNPTWIYPKVPNANMIKAGEEYEDYLFYRGLGNLDLPITFSVTEDEVVHVKNQSPEAIPFAFAFEKTGKVVRYKALGEVKEEASIAEADWQTPESNWKSEVYSSMRNGLVAQGLTTDEANGMVKTWWKSYFEHDGLRVFWILPTVELEKVLPLTVTPKPEKSVRVMVGRGDILRPSFEKKLVANIGKKSYNTYSSDRFHAAYKNRLESLIKEPVFQQISENELNNNNLKISKISGRSILGTSIRLQKGKPVQNNTLGNLGEWKVLNKNELMIGNLHFKLDRVKGVMIAYVDKEQSSNPGADRYEISLKRYLN